MHTLNPPVQFFTTGSGEWRRILPAGPLRDFYTRLYPHGQRWETLPTPMLEACRTWVECDFARADGDRLTPLVPILTAPDRALLHPWFEALASHTVASVKANLSALQGLAARFSGEARTTEHLLTILVLWSINMWVLRRLLAGPLGRHPLHGETGRYFIWGEELGLGPTHITGIRAVRAASGHGLCLIVSRTVERPGLREARRLYARSGGVSAVDFLVEVATQPLDIPALAQRLGVEAATLHRWLAEQRQVRVIGATDPPRLSIPVFDPAAMADIAPACDGVARRIADWLEADTSLEPLLARCSFAHCPRPATLCMLWHNSYYEATDQLMARGILPAFPAAAEGEWGVWLTSYPYGRAMAAAAHGG
jgi:hypothetical protein